MNGIGRSTWMASAALLLALAGPARAREVCKEEIARWCDGLSPVHELSCLQSHRADLSPACRDGLENTLVGLMLLLQDCTPDAFEHCRNVGRGQATVECLSAHQGNLTLRCQEDFTAFTTLERASAKSCGPDADRHCPGVKPGRGDVVICLLYKGKDLSPACRKLLSP